MSVQLAPNHVLKRIALEYNPEGRFADKPCPPGSKVAIIAAHDPSSLLRKKLRSVVRNGGVGALRMLRLHGEVTARGVATGPLWEGFVELIQKEADRLVDRAMDLSTRHGHKARVRLNTIKALRKAGFVKAKDFDIIEHNMLKISDVQHHLKNDDSIRWQLLKKAYYCAIVPSEALPPQTRPAPKKRKPMINNRERRANGTMPQKPITKAAFLLSEVGGKKAANKLDRQLKAKARRLKYRAKGKMPAGGKTPGEGVMVRDPDFDLCAAGHASSDKVAK